MKLKIEYVPIDSIKPYAGNVKKRIPDSLFVRSVSSTVVGQAFDNGLFAFIAFFNVLPLKAILSMIAGGTLIEIITEIAVYPLLRICIKKRCKQ